MQMRLSHHFINPLMTQQFYNLVAQREWFTVKLTIWHK